jgi:hypothetical protein
MCETNRAERDDGQVLVSRPHTYTLVVLGLAPGEVQIQRPPLTREVSCLEPSLRNSAVAVATLSIVTDRTTTHPPETDERPDDQHCAF